jgi:phospholipid-transporting ATPase
VKIVKDEYFPADLIMLTSSEVKGIAYIETKSLDGETNLKHKLSHIETYELLGNSDEKLADLPMEFKI